jgi:hypothetical protein
VFGLILIIGFELFNSIFDHRMYPYPYDGLRMKVKNRISQTSGQKFDVIILGDCFNLEGADPRVIEKKTGLKTFNFGAHSDYSILTTYMFYKNYLKNNKHKPKFMIINFIPEVMVYGKQSFTKRTVPFLFDVHQGNFPMIADEVDWRKVLLYNIPSLKHKEYYQKGKILKGLAFADEIDDFVASVTEEGGLYNTYKYNLYGEHRFPSDSRYLFRPSDFWMKYLNKMIELSEKNGVRVLYPIFTAPPDWYENFYVPNNIIRIYKMYLETLKQKYPNFDWVDFQGQLDLKLYYRDTVHLNIVGKRKYSELISAALLNYAKKLMANQKIRRAN